MGVSKNNGTPKSSILIGFSIINHPFGIPLFLETPIYIYIYFFCLLASSCPSKTKQLGLQQSMTCRILSINSKKNHVKLLLVLGGCLFQVLVILLKLWIRLQLPFFIHAPLSETIIFQLQPKSNWTIYSTYRLKNMNLTHLCSSTNKNLQTLV